MEEQTKNRLMLLAGGNSVATTILLLILKTGAFIGTGSMAILSSLLDSVQDFMTSLINMVAVHQAIQPADKAHRFGHGKAQGIGCLLQAFIISVSSVLLLIQSILHLIHAQNIDRIGLGVGIVLISIILTLLLVSFQTYVVRETSALSIKADRAHYTGDILMNIGVLCSLLAANYLNWLWVDGLFGIIVSVYLFHSVWNVMREACAMLMDRELPQDVRENVKKLALSVPSVKAVFGLRTREAGNKQFVQFTVQFDGRISLKRVHMDLDLIERILLMQYPNMDVIIHAEPYKKKEEDKKEKEQNKNEQNEKISRLDQNRIKRQQAKENGNTGALFGLLVLGGLLLAGNALFTQVGHLHHSLKDLFKSLVRGNKDTLKQAAKSLARDEIQQVAEAVDRATDDNER